MESEESERQYRLRICNECGGEFELTEENFIRNGSGFSYRCISCYKKNVMDATVLEIYKRNTIKSGIVEHRRKFTQEYVDEEPCSICYIIEGEKGLFTNDYKTTASYNQTRESLTKLRVAHFECASKMKLFLKKTNNKHDISQYTIKQLKNKLK